LAAKTAAPGFRRWEKTTAKEKPGGVRSHFNNHGFQSNGPPLKSFSGKRRAGSPEVGLAATHWK